MRKWEYYSFTVSWRIDAEENLKVAGECGWELVSVTERLSSYGNPMMSFFFKRELY